MPQTRAVEDQIEDPDNLTPAEHDAIGDGFPHHARGHTVLNASDHTDIEAVYSGGPTGYDTLIRNAANTAWQVRRDMVTNVDPTASNDSTQGYTVGSTWLNTAENSRWICFDATATAAVWLVTTNELLRALSKTIQIGFGDNNQNFNEQNNASPKIIRYFRFFGTDVSTPTSVFATVSRGGGDTGEAFMDIRRDDTGDLVASGSWTAELPHSITITPLTNLPAAPTVMYVEIYKSSGMGSKSARIHHIIME